MGRDLSEIRMRYRQTVEQLEDMSAMLDAMKRCVTDDLGAALSQISVSWKGTVAEQYQRRGNRLKRKYLGRLEDLEQCIITLRLAARNIYEAEMQNVSRASSEEKGD